MERKGAVVNTTCFYEFVHDAISTDPGSDHGLTREQLFGVYTSWCLLNNCP